MKHLILTGFVLGFASLSAAAQDPLSLGGDADILIVAEKATYKGRETLLQGQVDVRQGKAQILSDRMKIFRDPADDSSTPGVELGAVSRIEAEGNFVYITPENRVTGDRGVYVKQTGVITVTGNVKVRQPGGNSATTDKLIYNVNTDTIRFAGNCIGADCKDRPTIRIGNGN